MHPQLGLHKVLEKDLWQSWCQVFCSTCKSPGVCRTQAQRGQETSEKTEVKQKQAHKQAATEQKLLCKWQTVEYKSRIELDIGHAQELEKENSSDAVQKCKWCGQSSHKTKDSRLCPFNKKNIAAQEEKEAKESKIEGLDIAENSNSAQLV